MWLIHAISGIPVEFDFSSSGQSPHTSTAIEAAGVRLINALDLVEFDPLGTQVHVCSCCGYSHCESGNWVALRRVGAFVVWVPALALMGGGEWERQQYAPPGFLATRGAPIFPLSVWAELRRLRNDVPELSDLPPLNSREAVQLLQWTAPRRMLGTFPEQPHLDRGGVLAVTDGDVEAEVQAVNVTLTDYFSRPDPLVVVPSATVWSRIEFWLDLPGEPGWSVFGRGETGIVLLLGDELAVSPGGLTSSSSGGGAYVSPRRASSRRGSIAFR